MIKKIATGCAVLGMSALLFSGCSHSPNLRLVNELHFPLDAASEIQISYDEEPITFFKSETNKLIIKEYMTSDRERYYANVAQDRESITISEGAKPFFQGDFSRSIEVYLPTSYHQTLTVTTTDGDIDCTQTEFSLETLRMDSTAGTVQLDTVAASQIYLSTTKGTLDIGSLEANQIDITTTSGEVTCEKLNGAVTYKTTSGNADIKAAVGSGSYRAENSGTLNVVYTEVIGNLSFFNKNDAVQITLPKDLEFYFIATTKNGSISTPVQADTVVDGGTTKGTVGSNPTATVELETKNGRIEVTQ